MSAHDKEFDDYAPADDLTEKLTAMSDDEAQRRAEILRAGLEEYELEAADKGLIEGFLAGDGPGGQTAGYRKPVVAVIGRPNVGKSTLVNRILGYREAVVEDVPGVTRDRVSYPAEWNSKEFTLVDTGGWETDARGFYGQVAEQAEYAVGQADVVLFVVDAVVGATVADEAIVKILRRAQKPVLLVANKVDDEKAEPDAAMLWSLGLGQPYPVSSLHGRGVADMLDATVRIFADGYKAIVDTGYGSGLRRVALVGRPNVGKSSLLNTLAGGRRVVVDDHAGTTRDPVDEVVELGGALWRFVDTAGIRRRVHQQRGSDYYASLRTQLALERAEIALVLLEADRAVSEQDVRVVQRVLDSGRALVLAFNKWDLLNEEGRDALEKSIKKDLSHVSWAPRANISALTGWHKDKLLPALETALSGWDNRIPTGRLNAFLGEFMAAHPHPLRGGKQPRILFGTQASAQPPKFVLFTTGFLEAGYRRFLVRRLRETFNFEGTPVEISMRVRQKNSKRGVRAR